MLLQAPTLYHILIYSCIQHVDFLPACGAGDLSIGSWDWAARARPALISAYLQERCAKFSNFFQAEACSHSMIRGASNVHTCRYLLSGV